MAVCGIVKAGTLRRLDKMELKQNGILKPIKRKERGAVIHLLVFLCLLVALGCTALFGVKAYFDQASSRVSVSPSSEVEKGDIITLVFSSQMLRSSVENGIGIEPSVNFEKSWKDDKTLLLRVAEDLRPESEYQIFINGAKTKWMVPQGRINLALQSAQPPKAETVYPENGQTDVDRYESIKVGFDKPIVDDYKLEVMINPMTGFDYVLDDTLKQLVIVPQEKLEDLTQYKIKIDLMSKKYDDYRKTLYEGSFTTKKPTEVAYSFDENGDPLKTEERKEDVEPAIKEGRYIDIDLSSQTLFIFEDGQEKGAYKVSTGKRGMNTPEGTFKVRLKAERPWSKKYGLYMPWFIGFTSLGHGIHELPEWPGGYKEGASHLGTPVSHGCVRLGVGPAKTVYDFVSVGDPIVIHQ